MFVANTKFLLTSEYLVLDDVPGLAIPLSYSQTMTYKKRDDNVISLTAYDHTWAIRYSQQRLTNTITWDDLASQCLFFLSTHWYISWWYDFVTQIDFPRERWLGTSSTLISLFAQQSWCDPFLLYNNVCTGSGYDVACAQATSPLIYNRNPLSLKPISLSSSITDHIFFIYSNKKQTSNTEVQSYRTLYPDGIDKNNKKIFSDLIHELISHQDLATRSHLLTTHDTLLSAILHRPRLTDQLPRTQDLWVIKPLWARWWDFFLLLSDQKPDHIKNTCKEHGHDVCFSRDEIIVNI